MKHAESAKAEIDAYSAEENELVVIEQKLRSAETVLHNILSTPFFPYSGFLCSCCWIILFDVAFLRKFVNFIKPYYHLRRKSIMKG